MFEEMTPKEKELLWIGAGLTVAAIIGYVVFEKSAAATPATPTATPAAPTAVPVAPTSTSGISETLLGNATQPTSITQPLSIGVPLNGSVSIGLPPGATWISFAVAAPGSTQYSYTPVTGSVPYTFTYGGPGIATAAWTDSTGAVNTTYLSFYTVTI
jgi:hypothetical protein